MPHITLYTRLGIPPTPRRFDPSHKFVSSPLIRSPVVFGWLRLLVALYTLAVLVLSLVWRIKREGEWRSYFSYFTYLSYIGVCAYYWAAAKQTHAYGLRWRKAGAGSGYPLQSWFRIFQALHVLLQASIVTFPLLVTITFWALLSSSDTLSTPYKRFLNVSVHILNTVFALFEIFLSNSPPAPWLALPVLVLCLAGYVGVAYITNETQGFYVYPFLDPTKQKALVAAYICGILVAQIIIFITVRYVVVFRERWARKSGRVLQEDTNPEADDGEGERGISDDWEEVERPSGPQHS